MKQVEDSMLEIDEIFRAAIREHIIQERKICADIAKQHGSTPGRELAEIILKVR